MTLQHILYIEDDDDIRAIAQVALEVVGGFTLKVCESGRAAIDAVNSGYKPELILLDVMMPGMDGPTTLAALRELEATSNTPAIFMTAKVQPSEVAYYASLGALGVLAKPFDPMKLAQQVRDIWEHRGD